MYNCVDFLVAVTIYVKKEEEKVYNALMLDSLTVGDMVDAVSDFFLFLSQDIVFYIITKSMHML